MTFFGKRPAAAPSHQRPVLRLCGYESFLTAQEVLMLGKTLDCAICTCDDPATHSSQYFLALSCGHCFHSHCVLSWFATLPNNSCPVCRRDKCAIVPTDLLPFDWAAYTHAESRDDGTCAVCRCTEGERLHLACGHNFHKACFTGWSCKRKVCPLCAAMPVYLPVEK